MLTKMENELTNSEPHFRNQNTKYIQEGPVALVGHSPHTAFRLPSSTTLFASTKECKERCA